MPKKRDHFHQLLKSIRHIKKRAESASSLEIEMETSGEKKIREKKKQNKLKKTTSKLHFVFRLPIVYLLLCLRHRAKDSLCPLHKDQYTSKLVDQIHFVLKLVFKLNNKQSQFWKLNSAFHMKCNKVIGDERLWANINIYISKWKDEQKRFGRRTATPTEKRSKKKKKENIK